MLAYPADQHQHQVRRAGAAATPGQTMEWVDTCPNYTEPNAVERGGVLGAQAGTTAGPVRLCGRGSPGAQALPVAKPCLLPLTCAFPLRRCLTPKPTHPNARTPRRCATTAWPPCRPAPTCCGTAPPATASAATPVSVSA